jgi:hypothetical protein
VGVSFRLVLAATSSCTMARCKLTVAVTCGKHNAKIALGHCATGLSVLELFVQGLRGSGEPLIV